MAMEAAGRVRLTVFDTGGRLVRRLVDDFLAAGGEGIAWDGHDGAGAQVAAGVYFYRLELSGEVLTRKIVLAR